MISQIHRLVSHENRFRLSMPQRSRFAKSIDTAVRPQRPSSIISSSGNQSFNSLVHLFFMTESHSRMIPPGIAVADAQNTHSFPPEFQSFLSYFIILYLPFPGQRFPKKSDLPQRFSSVFLLYIRYAEAVSEVFLISKTGMADETFLPAIRCRILKSILIISDGTDGFP